MRKTVMLIITVICTACGLNYHHGSQYKDPILTEYINEVMSDISNYRKDVNLEFIYTVDSWEFSRNISTDKEVIAGICTYNTTNYSTIESTLTEKRDIDIGRHVFIHPVWWESLTKQNKKLLVLHEMLHCAWGAEHESSGVMTEILNEVKDSEGYYRQLQSAVDVILNKRRELRLP